MFIYRTYVLERKADAKFSLGEIWNLLQAGPLPNNASNFCRQKINCMRAKNYIQRTSGSPLNIEAIKKTHQIMMDKEKYRKGKNVLVGGYRTSSVFADYHIFAPAGLIERYMECASFRFLETKIDDPITAATNLFGSIIDIHLFEDRNGRICGLILAHVLMQTKCCIYKMQNAKLVQC